MIPGTMTGNPINGKRKTQATPVKKLTKKPTNAELGDLSNSTRTSTPGIAPGANTWEKPLKAGTISVVKA